ncbi:type I-E CRISPR-associated endonuclease Cas1e [Streptomyces scopuliridis]|uniref:Type I-E CRISPR-associated endonuclease Cas1e n=1 Tax=Streptomyces scopuliridis TaxID=452529 RepID=A0ACD4ZU13_9ACTN|nr:type I-E CRISPR-associated endonuclease Cas1e [Streptomyces scopuliridis]WSC01517.1 type I-E CRISPR-associated endonuclease Cas1e [Streptomyces scopuliridis]WSC04946.1 type I-E CRISPR-associated endonuclease Cas1e [Streptomyces scopuliridis]
MNSLTTPSNARRRLAAPTVAMLPRIADSLSFLYLDIVRIHQDDTGVCAEITSEKRGTETVYLPTAALSCVLLGPGTSITARALATFARHGTTILTTGSGGVRCYSATLPDSLTTTWLEKQTRAWADDTQRLTVATAMYKKRFGTLPGPAPTLDHLRGFEGQRVKAHYQLLAKQYKIGRFRRTYDPAAWDEQDPVNLALSSANTCLYGIVHAAILALGCSPALGYVHNGNQQAFVYDIADLYKADLTIPLAFSLHNSTSPEAEARRSFRDGLRLFKLLPRIVGDIQQLLAPETDPDIPDPEEQLVDLWDPVTGAIPGGTNHAATT